MRRFEERVRPGRHRGPRRGDPWPHRRRRRRRPAGRRRQQPDLDGRRHQDGYGTHHRERHGRRPGGLDVTDTRVLATVTALRASWTDGPGACPVNASDGARGVGPMSGRFPGDTYDGNDSGTGHPGRCAPPTSPRRTTTWPRRSRRRGGCPSTTARGPLRPARHRRGHDRRRRRRDPARRGGPDARRSSGTATIPSCPSCPSCSSCSTVRPGVGRRLRVHPVPITRGFEIGSLRTALVSAAGVRSVPFRHRVGSAGGCGSVLRRAAILSRGTDRPGTFG